jgi:hypothetical protein
MGLQAGGEASLNLFFYQTEYIHSMFDVGPARIALKLCKENLTN